MEVNGDPDKRCHILTGKGALTDESGCRECGEYLYYPYFFPVSLKLFLKCLKLGAIRKKVKMEYTDI